MASRRFFNKLFQGVSVAVSSFFTVVLATGMRGEWLLLYLSLKRLLLGEESWTSTHGDSQTEITNNSADAESCLDILERYNMQNVGFYVFVSLLGGFVIFYGVGGWLKWHYYRTLRERAADWKCQPDRFLSAEDANLEFYLGTINMAIASTVSGVLVTHILNGGHNTFYFNISDYGWIYFLLSIPCLHVYNEAAVYYSHRAMHIPYFYKRYHKVHHRFKAPTPWSAAAMHPYEMLVFQVLAELPIFIVPIHAGVYIFWLIYGFYYGILGHSGIDIQIVVPWQPSVFFHDDHHKYFHCNFGMNSTLFDKLHDTLRRGDRFYSEKTFGGKGASNVKARTTNKIKYH